MLKSNFTFKGEEDLDIYVYKYEPKIKENIKALFKFHMECQKKLKDMKDLLVF